jgi:hypothetical protein
MIRFSEDDEEFLDRITPPVSPPPTDHEMDDRIDEKALWYNDKGTTHSGINITVKYPNPARRYLLAGESVEVDVVCNVKQLQLLSGFLEGFSVTHAHCEETLCFQEVLLYPHKQLQDIPQEFANASDSNQQKYINNNNVLERRYKFWLTVPNTATPSLRLNSKTGIYYRIRVGGIGEVQHFSVNSHALSHHSLRTSYNHVMGGVDNYIPIKVRNYTCEWVKSNVLGCSPQTSFVASTTLGSGELSMKVHLFGSSPFAVLGQLCTFFVTIENNTDKQTRGITVKLVQSFQAKSPSLAFLTGSVDNLDTEFQLPRKSTITKYKFYNDTYCSEPHTKKQTEIAIVMPYNITPSIITQNILATYTLLVRVDVTSTHGFSGEMPLLVFPCCVQQRM